MYLIDTNVISESRKGAKADPGVQAFFRQARALSQKAYLSAVTMGELRRGVELLRHRGDAIQAQSLEKWLTSVADQYADDILDFDAEAAQVWGRLRVPHPEHALDKQIAAIAWVNDLTVVTRNASDFIPTGVRVKNPFGPG